MAKKKLQKPRNHDEVMKVLGLTEVPPQDTRITIRARFARGEQSWGDWTEIGCFVQTQNYKNEWWGFIGLVAPDGWAEYTTESFDEINKTFAAEDYFMQVWSEELAADNTQAREQAEADALMGAVTDFYKSQGVTSIQFGSSPPISLESSAAIEPTTNALSPWQGRLERFHAVTQLIQGDQPLDQYARLKGSQKLIEQAIKEIKPEAEQDALSRLALRFDGSNKTAEDWGGIKADIAFVTRKPKPKDNHELETLAELIQLEKEKAERENATMLQFCKSEVKRFNELIEAYGNTPEGVRLQAEYDELEKSLTAQQPELRISFDKGVI